MSRWIHLTVLNLGFNGHLGSDMQVIRLYNEYRVWGGFPRARSEGVEIGPDRGGFLTICFIDPFA